MRHLRNSLGAAVSFLIVSLASICSIAQETGNLRHQQNVVYGEVHGIGLLMDIFQPSQDSNGLAIVDVISGSWDSSRGKIRDHQRAQVFDRLCARGYTVFAVRPGSVSKFTIDEMVAHLEKGVRWIKQNHAEYGINPKRMGLMGASAGGHLASLLAVRNGKSTRETGATDASVLAVSVFFPPTDLTEFAGGSVDLNGDSGIAPVLRQALIGHQQGLSAERVIEIQRLASPAKCVTENCPPFLIIHGTADLIVPIQQSEKMVAALQEREIEVRFVKKEGGGHPWPTIFEEVELFGDWFDQHLHE